MAFWGIEVKPGTPYVHQYDDESGRLHISQATIVPGSSNKRSVVQCTVGDKQPIYLCSLLPEKLETCLLNLDFEEEDEVTFSVIGPNSVHLSGFFYGEEEEQGDGCCDDDESDDSFGEGVMITDSEDEDGSYDSEDEDVDAEFGLCPAPNSGVRIEEIVEEEKPANEEDNSKQAKKKKSKNENSNSQIVVKSESDAPIIESEDEDGFPKSKGANKSDTLKTGSRTEEKKDASVDVKKSEKKDKEDASIRKLKRKLVAVIQDEPTGDNNEPHESSVQPDSTNPQSEMKQKKNKKKKVEEKEVNVTNSDGVGNSPAATNDLKQTSETKKEKKKKNKQEESVATPSTEEKNSKKGSIVEKKEKTNANAKATQVRTYPNGLVVEEIAMGKPDGKKASKGKKVGVRYIGKLKKNDKIFDSCTGGKPFTFRLGIGEVISGWDVGVEGMRVGDKRRLTIPPAMGYGHSGAPPAIPGNAWLLFDVELVAVN